MKKVFWLVVSVLLAVPTGAYAQQQQWSMGYWTSLGNPGIAPSAIDWAGLTHVVHAWALVRPDGSLDLDTSRVSAEGPVLINYAHANGVKAVLGIAQAYWGGQVTNLQQAITQNRWILVDNIMRIVDSYGFDGVDLDWEPFDPAVNGPAMLAFAADLRSRLGAGRTLSAAAIPTDYRFWGTAHGYFDRIGVMTYDLGGTWDPYTWHNSAIYSADDRVWSIDLAVKRFTTSGVPAAKLAIGIPFFGYKWTGHGMLGPGLAWVVQPTTQQVYYQGLAGLITPQNYRWDAGAKVPYLTVDGALEDNFYSYDNEQSVAEKVRYAETQGLGGWIIWELSGDYLPAKTPNQPLLAAIKNARSPKVTLFQTPQPNNPTPTTPPAAATTNPSGNAVPSNPITGNAVPSNPVTGNGVTTNPVTGNGLTGNTVTATATTSTPVAVPAKGDADPRFPFIYEDHIPRQNHVGQEIQRIYREFYAEVNAGRLTVSYITEKAALVRTMAAGFVSYVSGIGNPRAIQGGADIAAFAEIVAGGFEKQRPVAQAASVGNVAIAPRFRSA